MIFFSFEKIRTTEDQSKWPGSFKTKECSGPIPSSFHGKKT